MKPRILLKHKFVDYIPETLDDLTIYISIEFATAVHKCCCGCGHEVVTPLSPTDWKLIYNGKSISLDPSIGNWNFECQSHYLIINNQVRWAPRWTRQEIDSGRAYDLMAKERYFNRSETSGAFADGSKDRRRKSFWQKLRKWLPLSSK